MILELNKTTVFKRGTLRGFKTSTLYGGQIRKQSTDTLKLEWKKAQKKPKKKRTSDEINQIILVNRFFCTIFV